ncbi:hypothetical protein JCM18899A_24630 [Nocardioides sp. AN3]
MLVGLPELGDHGAGVLQEALPEQRRRHPPGTPVEQGHAEDLLHLTQTARHDRLGDVQRAGSTHDTACIGDRDDKGQVTQLQASVEETIVAHTHSICP